MWERDLKQFADDYNFVSLIFDNEAVESAVADDVTTAKVHHIHKYTYIHNCTYTHTRTCTCTHTLVHVHTHIHTHACICARICTYVFHLLCHCFRPSMPPIHLPSSLSSLPFLLLFLFFASFPTFSPSFLLFFFLTNIPPYLLVPFQFKLSYVTQTTIPHLIINTYIIHY